jgi:hypothetical protein
MRPILRLLGTRYGIALMLALLVLGVVGIVRGVAGSYRQTLGAAVESPRSSSSIDPTAGNDSLLTPESPAPPVTSPGAAEPAAVAADFIRAWLAHDGVAPEQWRAGFAKYATPALRDKLKDTDPAGVPAQRTAGPVVLQNRSAAFVEASMRLDSGTVRLRLLATNGRWLVDGVDWERT